MTSLIQAARHLVATIEHASAQPLSPAELGQAYARIVEAREAVRRAVAESRNKTQTADN